MINSVTAQELRAMFGDGAELALLDAREEQAFGASHIFYATCLPPGRIELRAPQLLPRRDVRVVYCDAGEGEAERAAERLAACGWTNVSILAGGIGAWAEAGFELFSGVNVPSKAFGECVERLNATPSWSAAELSARIDAGEPLVILDSRPLAEFEARNIPGGICTPGAELVYRVHDLAPSPQTTVVVNCAGRTRSIIGTQSLIDAGVPNPVRALRNGTMGWHLAGYALESGSERRAPEPSAEGLAIARRRAAAVRERFGVPLIDRDTLERYRAQAGERTLYVFDVRLPEEYEAGHLEGTLSAPGGQLVQETDQYAAVLGARIVLLDDTGVRASMTASWLRRMGWDACVVADAFAGIELETGPQASEVPGLERSGAPRRTPEQISAMLAADDLCVLDLSTSRAYREGHVPGAWWGLRSRLHVALARLPAAGGIVLVSEDGRMARLAAAEVEAMDVRPVVVMEGGMRAWHAARLATESGATRLADEPDDIWQRPYEKDWGNEQDMRDYLEWEVDLVAQLHRDGTARFELPASQ